MFIAIEGIDCSGKSTVSKMLAKERNAILYRTPPKNIIARRDEIDAKATPIEHYRFYLDGIRTASREIWEVLASGKEVVCDRYWLSTYVYHVAMGVSVNTDDFTDIIRPDLTVLLLVSSDVQVKRFLERGMSIGDRRMSNRQLELAKEFKKAMAKFPIPQLIVNTDHHCPAEIVDKIQSCT